MTQNKEYSWFTGMYDDGDYIFELVSKKDIVAGDMEEVWIHRRNVGMKMYCFGIPYNQPSAKDGKTRLHYDDIVAMVEANADDYKAAYEEELMERASKRSKKVRSK